MVQAALGNRKPVGQIAGAGFLPTASPFLVGSITGVGHHADDNWDEFTQEPTSVRNRIERIYSRLQKSIDFGGGIMQ